ncbi:HEPN domain-containing protein [Pseudomonas fitomaticsae]
MFDKVTKLELSKSYFFKVIYREGCEGFAATLELTPELITFKVMTERSCKLSSNALEAECDDLTDKFLLKGLYCVGSRNATISAAPSVGFYEIEFTVESVEFCPKHTPYKGEFESIQIYSSTINDWIGYTTTQDNILHAHAKGEDISPHLTEFVAEANHAEEMGIQYNGTHRHSPLTYEQAFSFPPSLFYTFGIEENAKNPYITYTKIFNLLAFFTGIQPDVQRVDLEYDYNGYAMCGSLYFPTKDFKSNRSDTYAMFPLGVNQRFDDWGLPPVPASAFSIYFAPGSELPDIFSKYVKYRTMGNVEDRLLGYFRLLEKHCYRRKNYLPDELFTRYSRLSKKWAKANGLTTKEVKNFEGGLKRFNGQKYNTHKCVTDFISSLPEEIQEGLGVTNDLLTEICTLRNNITHANKYNVEENKIYTYTAYVHHLLIFALLEKLGVELPSVINLIGRLRNN